MPKLRTTINPLDEIEVSDAEATDLERLGLVLKTNATTETGLLNASGRQVAGNDNPED